MDSLIIDAYLSSYFNFIDMIINICQLNTSREVLLGSTCVYAIYQKIKKSPDKAYKAVSLFKNKSSTKFRETKTINGYPFDLMKSALQKHIRRGHNKQSIYCANELYAFRYLEDGQRYLTNMINRIRVICLEDIGLADPYLMIGLDKQLDLLDNKNSREAFLTLSSIIHSLSNNLHYRFYSHIKSYIFSTELDNIHESKFKYKTSEFYDEIHNFISLLENNDIRCLYWAHKVFESEEKLNVKKYHSTKPRFLIMDVIYQYFKVNNIDIKVFEVCLKWLKILKIQEAFLCMFHPICVYLFSDLITHEIKEIKIKSIEYANFLNKSIKHLTTYSYIADKHTHAGRSKGKGTSDFAIEGSLVAFEDVYLRTRIEKLIGSPLMMNYVKVRTSTFRTEKNTFTLKSRAQLTCSKSRPDVYFALDEKKNNVVVKGPFLTFDDINLSYQLYRLMSLFPKINTFQINIQNLIPDMFESVPIGIRNKIVKGKDYYFLIMEDLFDQIEYPTKIKSSKCWPDTKVVDYDKLFNDGNKGFANPERMSNVAIISLIHQLAWRYAFEIGDFAPRNFCYVGDMAYNLDIDNFFVGQTIRWKETERKRIVKVFKTHKTDIINVWNEWLELAQDRWIMIKRILNLSDNHVEKIKTNIHFLINGFEDFILKIKK